MRGGAGLRGPPAGGEQDVDCVIVSALISHYDVSTAIHLPERLVEDEVPLVSAGYYAGTLEFDSDAGSR